MPHDATITMVIDIVGLTQDNLGSKITHEVTGTGRLSQNTPGDSTKDTITIPHSNTLNWRFREKNSVAFTVTEMGMEWKPSIPVGITAPVLQIIDDPDNSSLKQLETHTHVGRYPNNSSVQFPYTLLFTIGANMYRFDPKLAVNPVTHPKP